MAPLLAQTVGIQTWTIPGWKRAMFFCRAYEQEKVRRTTLSSAWRGRVPDFTETHNRLQCSEQSPEGDRNTTSDFGSRVTDPLHHLLRSQILAFGPSVLMNLGCLSTSLKNPWPTRQRTKMYVPHRNCWWGIQCSLAQITAVWSWKNGLSRRSPCQKPTFSRFDISGPELHLQTQERNRATQQRPQNIQFFWCCGHPENYGFCHSKKIYILKQETKERHARQVFSKHSPHALLQRGCTQFNFWSACIRTPPCLRYFFLWIFRSAHGTVVSVHHLFVACFVQWNRETFSSCVTWNVTSRIFWVRRGMFNCFFFVSILPPGCQSQHGTGRK